MNICYSFWSVPCNRNRQGVNSDLQWVTNLYSFALSKAYAHRHSYKALFYGDEESIRRFKPVRFDDYITLDISSNYNHCWAQGKFYAYQKMQLGDVHIDGDVFMKGDKIYDILESDYDGIVQNCEDQLQTEQSCYTISRNLMKDVPWSDGCTSLLKPTYNTGVCGFKNQELKDKYINHYFDSLKKVPIFGECPDGFIPDLIIEQQHLYELSQGYNIKTLLGKNESVMRNRAVYDDAINMDFQHVLSVQKFTVLDKIREELKDIDPIQCRILDAVTGYNKAKH